MNDDIDYTEFEKGLEELKSNIQSHGIEHKLTKPESLISYSKELAKDLTQADIEEVKAFQGKGKEFVKSFKCVKIDKNTYAFYGSARPDEIFVFFGNSERFNNDFVEYAYKLCPEKNYTQSLIIKSIKTILFPKYYIAKALNEYLEDSTKKYYETILGLKALNEKLDSFDLSKQKEFSLKDIEIHALNLFFRYLKGNEIYNFLGELKEEYLKQQGFNQKLIRLKRLFIIYAIFFPNNLNLSDLKEELSKFDDRNIFEKIIESKAYIEITDKPLKIGSLQVKYIAKEVFQDDISVNTIKKYCEEMNIKATEGKQGIIVNTEKIKHLFLA